MGPAHQHRNTHRQCAIVGAEQANPGEQRFAMMPHRNPYMCACRRILHSLLQRGAKRDDQAGQPEVVDDERMLPPQRDPRIR